MPRWNGGVIGAANNPTSSSAKGIWSLSEATKAIRAGLWPPSNAGADPYFENVTLLLPGDGTNGAQNNTFLDSSTNNFTITRNGNTTQGTFTPFSKPDGRWSNYFDGAGGSYLTSASSSNLALGSGEFTIEAWIFTADTSFMIVCSTTSGGCGFGYNIDNGSQGLWLGRAGVGVDATSGVQLVYNQWNHVAVTRDSSNVVKFWVNGTQSGSNTTVTTNYGTGSQVVRIAADGISASTFGFAGHLSNLRITKAGALYSSTFTPSTAPLTTTVSSGTAQLLTCQSNRFVDNSANAFALTVSGSGTQVQTFSPFPTLTAYAAGTNGGSGYFDGSGDHLVTPSNAALGLGTGDFTVECWYYHLSRASTDGLFAPGTSNLNIYINTSGTLGYFNGTSGQNSSQTVPLNTWGHIALVRVSGTIKMYYNGVEVLSQSNTTNFSTTNWYIGTNSAADSDPANGYMTDARIVKGTAVYTSAFTPPTAPLTAISGTSLLLNYTNGGIIDTSMSNDLETVGNAQISTTQSKFGGGSMYFDGTGDNLSIRTNPAFNFGSGQFTIEFWYYPTTLSGTQCLITNYGGSTTGFVIQMGGSTAGSGKIDAGFSGDGADITSTNGLTANTWNHIAISGTPGATGIKLFINGTQTGSTYTGATSLDTSATLLIGQVASTNYLTGYIDDLRITKGYARYTANFTAPVAPFNGFGD